MASQQKKDLAPALTLDAATLAAATAQLREHDYQNAVNARPDLANTKTAGLWRFKGPSVQRRLRDELNRLKTDLSRGEPVPTPSDEDFLLPGGVLYVGVGDRVPDPQFFEKLSEGESAGATVQDALRYRAVARPVTVAEAGLSAAEQVLSEKTRRVAEATRAREDASDARDVAVRSVEREKARLSEFLDGKDEDALRSVLASLKAPAKPKTDEGDFLAVSRGGGVVERIRVAS